MHAALPGGADAGAAHLNTRRLVMDLPIPRTKNILQYAQMLGRQSVPTGGCQRKPVKAGRWRKKAPRRAAAVCFDLKGACSGDLSEVMSVGMRMAREALDRGDKDFAREILNRLKKIPREYELEKLQNLYQRTLRKAVG